MALREMNSSEILIETATLGVVRLRQTPDSDIDVSVNGGYGFTRTMVSREDAGHLFSWLKGVLDGS